MGALLDGNSELWQSALNPATLSAIQDITVRAAVSLERGQGATIMQSLVRGALAACPGMTHSPLLPRMQAEHAPVDAAALRPSISSYFKSPTPLFDGLAWVIAKMAAS